jgi:DNA-binding NtrC family response regulator
MNGRHQILIVTQTPGLAADLRGWLSAHGYWITAADTYGSAKFHLEMQPSVVITELKLGEYNGLHLAVRANASHIPVLVIGDRDRFFEHEAEHLGAAYLPFGEVSRERILSFVESQIAHSDAREHDHLAWIDQSTVAGMRGEASGTPTSLPVHTGRRLRVN